MGNTDLLKQIARGGIDWSRLTIEYNTDKTYQLFTYYNKNNKILSRTDYSIGTPIKTIDPTLTETFNKFI